MLKLLLSLFSTLLSMNKSLLEEALHATTSEWGSAIEGASYIINILTTYCMYPPGSSSKQREGADDGSAPITGGHIIFVTIAITRICCTRPHRVHAVMLALAMLHDHHGNHMQLQSVSMATNLRQESHSHQTKRSLIQGRRKRQF